MLALSSRSSRRVTGSARAGLWLSLAFLGLGGASAAQQSTPAQPSAAGGQATVQKSTEAVPVQRIPRQQALTTTAVDGVLREASSTNETRTVAAAQLTLRHLQSGQVVRANSSVEGVFRIL